VGAEDTGLHCGHPTGPTETPSQGAEKKGCTGVAARGDAKPAPTCETFQKSSTGCTQCTPGKTRILLCLFPLHLHRLGARGWLFLAGAALVLRGHSTDQAADAEPHCSHVHRHCRKNAEGYMGTYDCHALEGVGVENPLYPHGASWQPHLVFSPLTVSSPRKMSLIHPWQSRAGFSTGRMVTRAHQ